MAPRKIHVDSLTAARHPMTKLWLSVRHSDNMSWRAATSGDDFALHIRDVTKFHRECKPNCKDVDSALKTFTGTYKFVDLMSKRHGGVPVPGERLFYHPLYQPGATEEEINAFGKRVRPGPHANRGSGNMAAMLMPPPAPVARPKYAPPVNVPMDMPPPMTPNTQMDLVLGLGLGEEILMDKMPPAGFDVGGVAGFTPAPPVQSFIGGDVPDFTPASPVQSFVCGAHAPDDHFGPFSPAPQSPVASEYSFQIRESDLSPAPGTPPPSIAAPILQTPFRPGMIDTGDDEMGLNILADLASCGFTPVCAK